ncbi:DNA-binding protein [Herbaspirillum seropedicae]|uniref:DNA-binding protein n=1 Tax=Herbaspirillum seropedicae TaxID=964 RepID=UPI001123FE08|nr:DNA-binding protein [Herbaspirillum seropedicae]QDD66356.1 DNA-binding protein [Herbaspirillum seropedicae]
MPKDLTTSAVDRQNVLNNPYALSEIERAAGIQGIPFEGKSVVLKEQVAAFFEVTVRTVENYLEQNADELSRNGYEVLKGERLRSLKQAIATLDVPETHFGNISKTPQLGVFDFPAFLNLAMLVSESERAKLLRQVILDVVIDTINRRTGGGTKYINQRDEDYLQAAFAEESYRKQFTDALRDGVDMGVIKYALYTDKVYVSIFKEKAKEYRKLLKLERKDNVRATFYAEVLDLVAAYECGFADTLNQAVAQQGRKLRPLEVDALFSKFESMAHWRPLVEKARMKMASRDLAFRDALHLQLKEYIAPVQREDYERFIGEKSKELSERLEQAKDVMKRLKDRQ